jgi:hypothetical protein
MEIRWIAVLALLGSTGLTACSDKGDDSSGGESDADTDTDTDTDTDADADTDVHEAWHANTVSIDYVLGWDGTKNEVAAVSDEDGKPLANIVAISLYNRDETGLTPYQFCFVTYEIPAGTPARADSFGDYWMGIDLAALTPDISGKSSSGSKGDCEMIDEVVDSARGDGQSVEDFVASLGFGLDLGNFTVLDSDTYDSWESGWSDNGYEKKKGDWDDLEPFFALSGFTSEIPFFGNDSDPGPFGIGFGFLVDPKTGQLVVKDGASIPLDLSVMATAPSGYYTNASLYVYGSGF